MFLAKNIHQFSFVFFLNLFFYFFILKISPFGLISFDQPIVGMIKNLISELNLSALLPFYLMYNMTTSGVVTLQKYLGNYFNFFNF